MPSVVRVAIKINFFTEKLQIYQETTIIAIFAKENAQIYSWNTCSVSIDISNKKVTKFIFFLKTIQAVLYLVLADTIYRSFCEL